MDSIKFCQLQFNNFSSNKPDPVTLISPVSDSHHTPSTSNTCNTHSTFDTSHKRLGHAHSTSVRTVLDLCNISCTNKGHLDFCNACCLGKVHRLYAPPSETIYENAFELVFSDLWGPAAYVSSGNYSYYVTFMDAATRFTWIYFLKNKSDAFQAFSQFHSVTSVFLGY